MFVCFQGIFDGHGDCGGDLVLHCNDSLLGNCMDSIHGIPVGIHSCMDIAQACCCVDVLVHPMKQRSS